MGRDWWMSAATRGVKSYGLQQEFITPHCPDQNGLVERVIRTIKEQCVDRQRFQTLQHASRSLEKSRQHLVKPDDLAPFNPDTAAIKAARLMLEEIDECVLAGESFAFETTLLGIGYLRKIKLWQQLGYQVKLWFLSLPSAEAAVTRVAARVAQGGHNIPEPVIRRRFKSGLENFHKTYSKAVNSWVLYDNYVHPPIILDWSKK
jgi:predicted ABC-type ATPase